MLENLAQNHGIISYFINMYFTRIKKTEAQLEVMISALEMEYGAKDDERLAELMSKYFEVDIDDAKISLAAYRANKSEDYEQLSVKQECIFK